MWWSGFELQTTLHICIVFTTESSLRTNFLKKKRRRKKSLPDQPLDLNVWSCWYNLDRLILNQWQISITIWNGVPTTSTIPGLIIYNYPIVIYHAGQCKIIWWTIFWSKNKNLLNSCIAWRYYINKKNENLFYLYLYTNIISYHPFTILFKILI